MSQIKPIAKQVILALKKLANPEKAAILSRFFKTGPGEYGEGDVFWGITVPEQRLIAKNFIDLPLFEIKELLTSPIHEVRLTGALILVEKFKKSRDQKELEDILDFYLNNLKCFNNWDLIDLSAPKIIGYYLLENPTKKKLLGRLSQNSNMWVRRAAIVANLPLIKNNDCETTITLANKYLKEDHDLLHKATGWLLREVGKQDENKLLDFLDKNASQMPRVMLRYSLEKLSPELRKKYLTAK